MPDLPSITNFINSPPGQFSAGAVLAGIVWKCFDKVDVLLTDKTKFEIAIWLVGIKTEEIVPWPETFANVFDRVFGTKHLSWKCFRRSFEASFSVFLLTTILVVQIPRSYFVLRDWHWLAEMLLIALGANIFDFLSLLETRWFLSLMKKCGPYTWGALLFADVLITFVISLIPLLFWYPFIRTLRDYWIGSIPIGVWPELARTYFQTVSTMISQVPGSIIPIPPWKGDTYRISFPFYVSAFFTSLWLWLYAGSGFLLKFARRFDLGFDWFNRKFDIEKKPLSAIGLVAGSLVAILYWTWAVFRYFHPA